MNEYGCEECGAVGWHRDGEAVVKAREGDDGIYVEHVKHTTDDIVGGVWVGECGHPVRRGSALDRFFSILTPGEPVRLPPNR